MAGPPSPGPLPQNASYSEQAMAYEKCSDVNREFWEELNRLDPGEVTGRTGAVFRNGRYHLPFLDRELVGNAGDRGSGIGGVSAAFSKFIEQTHSPLVD